MTTEKGSEFSCPLPLSDYPEIVMAHGGGGALTQRLFEEIFQPAFSNPFLNARHDGAVVELSGNRLAFTTDSYVVRPHTFPGGDIGRLAVSGTVNDLLMCGAQPMFISLGLIIEEGFPVASLRTVIDSIRAEAKDANVSVITGDTKVVDKGKGDGIFINTSGIGVLDANTDIAPQRVRPGDAVILSGDIGRHGVAVMAAREMLDLGESIESDVASLGGPVRALFEGSISIHCLRDPTRGGLATALVEIADSAGVEISIDETAIPVSERVRGVCEILGLDPLYVANEGRFVAFVPEPQADEAIDILRRDPLSATACIIGTVKESEPGIVTCTTSIGGTRVIDMLSGEQLPRIC